MTTIVVVQKAGEIVIAADSQTTFGDARLTASYDSFSDKIFHQQATWFGIAGSAAHDLVLQNALTRHKKLKFCNRQDIFDSFRQLHHIFKEEFYLNPKEEENDPYESSQFTVVIANASGIYGLYSYREIFEFKEFWGIGSGRSFALGAMHAIWGKAKTAREVAMAGMNAGCEFDKNSAGPIEVFTLKLKASQ